MQSTKYCPRCRAANPIEIRFCYICGYSYASGNAPSPAPTVPPVPPTTSYPGPPNTPYPPHPLYPPYTPAAPPIPTRAVRPHHPHYETSHVAPPKIETSVPHRSIYPVEVSTPSLQFMSPVKQPATQPHTGRIGQPPSQPSPPYQPSPRQAQPAWPDQRQHPSGASNPTGYSSIEIMRGNTSGMRIQVSPLAHEYAPGMPNIATTSQAAEHWRTSWRNRQHAAAGPATKVSRGQSLVPEPLMAMQHSLMRMRAIVLPQNDTEKTPVHFWITLIVLLSLIGLLVVYIASTYTGFL